MDKVSIEKKSRWLLGEILTNQDRIWGDTSPQSLKSMIDPLIAAKVLGLEIMLEETLGNFGHKGDKFEVAGLLNPQKKQIFLSRRFKPEIIHFTAAHEIGHYLLHPDILDTMHRDRPIDGLKNTPNPSRKPEEREADYFAACFLLPRKSLRVAFQKTFKTNLPFVFDHDAAFHLGVGDPDYLLDAADDSLDREMSLAICESYKGRHFHSLSKQFKVSPMTMAIRLKELELIRA